MSKYIELAKKIKALADNGIEGEKVNAELLLKRLMKKYNLKPEDIEGETKKWFAFTDYQRYPSFSTQIICTVIGNSFSCYRKRKKIHLECTPYEAIEITNRLNFYYKLLIKEEDIFWKAFVRRNNLYPKNGEVIYTTEMSPEQLEEYHRVEKLANGIVLGQYHKQLK